MEHLGDAEVARPHQAVDHLEESGTQAGRHKQLQDVTLAPRSLPDPIQEPILDGEAGPL